MRSDSVAVPLRILIVEDYEDDALLLLRELRKGGYQLDSKRVDTVAGLRNALDERAWDLILSDYNLPGFTALDVLRMTAERHIDCPVLVVSGAVGEETVVGTMRAGAHDYLMKDNLTRLNSAVDRALHETEVRRQRLLAESALRESEEHFRQLAGNVDGVLWLIDTQRNRMIYVNPGYEQVWERPADPLFESVDRFLDAVHPEDYDRIDRILRDKGWVHLNAEYRVIAPDGEERWVSTRSFPIRDDQGRVYRCAGLTSDITERKRFEAEREKLFRALEQTADMVMITNRDGIIEYVNTAFEDVTGYARDEVIGKRPSILNSGLQDRDFFSRLWQSLTNGLPFTDLFINRRKDGDLYYEAKTITPVRDERAEITHFVATGKDVTRRLGRQEALQHAVKADGLTGLGNRVLLVDHLGKCLLQARRSGVQVGVMCIGVDLSAILGDEHMEQLGERLLFTAAHRLKATLGDSAVLARLGQSQFAAVANDVAGRAALDAIARRLMDAFAEPLEADGYSLYLNLVIGISLSPEDGEDTDALIHRAEAAMEYTRRRERGGYGFYHRDLMPLSGKPLAR
jgi:PAS domain S-box-containing protein/diguanylate cyclase (GGDEF)-like protein